MSEKFKTMPHSIEAEQSVLGAMLIDNEAPLTIFSALTGDDFYSAVNKKIYERMRELYINIIDVSVLQVYVFR